MIDINLYDFHDKKLESIFINSKTDFIDEIIIHIVDENELKLELKCIECSSCKISRNGRQITGEGWESLESSQ